MIRQNSRTIVDTCFKRASPERTTVLMPREEGAAPGDRGFSPGALEGVDGGD